jgi:SHAQKYF class myb-like DNA-binding protein
MFKISQTPLLNENEIYSNENNQNLLYKKHFIQPYFQLVISNENKETFLQKKKNRKLNSLSFQNNNSDSSNGRWTKEEHNRFIEAIIKFGNDWKKVQKYVSTRTSTQARSHAQKFLLKLRNSDFFKKKNIDKNLSWAKTIQFIKNNFSNEELESILKNVHCNINNYNCNKKIKGKKIKLNKLNSDSTEFNSDDSESDFSDFYNNKNTHFNDYRKESDFNCLFYLENENDNLKPNKSNDDYIQTFIQNFNRKGSYINDLDFTINDINNIYHDNKINNYSYNY